VRHFVALLHVTLASILLLPACRTAAQGISRPLTFTLASELPSGNPICDRIWLYLYEARATTGITAPAAILVNHPPGEPAGQVIRGFARYLANHGIHAVTL